MQASGPSLMDCCSPLPGMFDVFLNHRGTDVKRTFVAHLHQALQEAQCRPFLDKPALEKGQHGQNKIYEALRCARVHVAIFSEHYADSDYCLDELHAMVESKKLIIPVFYDVSPSVLRCEDPDGPYTKALNIHGRRSATDVKKWKDALRKAADLNGFKLDDYNGDEAELKTAIVREVWKHLRASQLPPVAPYQVGLKETSKELIATLNQMKKNVGILSLVGMGGIGKTTLAKEIYRCFQKNDTFEKKSFLMDVRESAILDLQKQLARHLFKQDVKDTKAFNKCFNRGMDHKVLIVIDDVDHECQFDQLIPDINKLRPGSRVIITSRDSNVVNNIMKNGNCAYCRHEMAQLSTTDSRHLFNWHAFQSTDAIDGFQELAEKVADACCGLALALEVIGRFLFDKREERDLKSTWPQTIKTLLSNGKDIINKLKVSYDGLSPGARMMFLDIACFMIGQREHIAMQIFEACKFDYEGAQTVFFRSLEDKCLVKLDEDRRIKMHDLLRDMGRQVVKNESQTMAAVPGMFDVFLNHRGPDVKQNFAAHLHQALQEAGCRPFLDMESLEKGQHGQKKIYEALGCANVHVAIFSEHYADSNFCLDELCAMLETKKLIIPVFYDVSPNDLHCKLHDGPYTKAFRKTHGRRPPSQVKKWKDALCRAAQLFGFQLANYNGDEAQLKTAIVSKVRDHLRASQLPPVAPYEVGLKETSKELTETLNRMEKDVGILSLVGMGGIGKTTLAKELYRSFEKKDTFEKKSILMNVRESAIFDLQKQLACDLFKKDVRNVGEFNECCNRGMDRKVLIVIDDVDQKCQFDQLIPNIKKLCPGSRIIITSRDSNVVNNIMEKNENCKYLRHEMALLNTTDSRHLFNWHAFHSTDAIDGFQELAKNVADACCGLPLALEVTGCFLFDKREECDFNSTWPQTIKTLINEKNILNKLKVSYDGLSPEARMMFLDIACFMVGQREHIAMQIFEACKFDYDGGQARFFSSLKDKCLVKLDEDRRIIMHDLLRDMGRQVVKNESRNMEKGTPSHLWNPEMVQRVLQNKEGTNQVRGLSTFAIGRDGICANNVAENYEGMKRLHFLLLDDVNVKGDFSNWSQELSWLQWINSDLLALPSKLKLQNLAVLDLTSNKKLTQIWPNDLEITCKDLRTLILSKCEVLEELPKDIGKLLKLNQLNLAFCSSLKALPDSMSQFKELKHLDLYNCVQLRCLPDSIVNLSQLKTFRLSGCHILKNLPMEIGKLQNLVELDLSECSQLRCLPDSIVNLSQLKTFRLFRCYKLENLPVEFGKLQSLVELDLSNCAQLRCLPDSIVNLSQLKTFQLSACCILENLPMEFEKLQSLVELDLSGCYKLGCLPDSIVHLSQLKTFKLFSCDKLENLPVEIGKLQSLVELYLSGCSQLGCLPDSIVNLSQLKTFGLWGCDKLENLPMKFGKLQSLVKLDLSSSQLGCLPDSIVNLSQLKTFRLRRCDKLKNLPVEFGKLQSLVELDLSYCSELRCLPDSIVNLSQLKTFQFGGCKKLENLPMEFGKLQSLVKLDLSCCFELGYLPDSIVHLSHLKTFRLVGCDKLENLPVEFGKLQSLVELDFKDCTKLGCLPDSIVNLSHLKTFRLSRCEKLENLPMEIGKLQSLVELNLSGCSKLGCLPDSIVNLSKLKTFRLKGCHKLENLLVEFRKLQSLVEFD
ncbi:unnamed protein product [Sphagnum troendelagicum]